MQLEKGLSRDMKRTQTKLTLICLFVYSLSFINEIVSLESCQANEFSLFSQMRHEKQFVSVLTFLGYVR